MVKGSWRYEFESLDEIVELEVFTLVFEGVNIKKRVLEIFLSFAGFVCEIVEIYIICLGSVNI